MTALQKSPQQLISHEEAIDVCRVVDDHQQNYADTKSAFLTGFTPGVARVHANIVNDFLRLDQIKGKRLLDIGPGVFPFALIARHLGAEVVTIEFDPLLADLGRRLGFEVYEDDLDMLPEGKFTGFDGVFLKGPFKACRQTTASMPQATARLVATITKEGWAGMPTPYILGTSSNCKACRTTEGVILSRRREARSVQCSPTR